MVDRPKPRRRRWKLLVSLLGIGLAVWAVRARLGERHGLDDGWQQLPPAPPVGPPAGETSDGPGDGADAPVDRPPTAQLRDELPVPARSRTVPATAGVAAVAAPALPDAPFGPGSLRALADGSSPDPAFTVKGKTATRVFHAAGGAYYTRTRADVWFRTPDDARAAGFTERGPRRHN
jgi:hypothetical protein